MSDSDFAAFQEKVNLQRKEMGGVQVARFRA